MQKYICDMCLWVYDPAKGCPDLDVPPGTPWEQVPDDFLCPICGVEKEKFSPFK